MTGRFIGKTVVEHRREFIEKLQYGKQIDDLLDKKKCQKRPQAQKPIFLGLESEQSENMIILLKSLKIYMKFAHIISVQHGSYAFPNELMRFRIEATPIWGKIQKHSEMQ